MVVTILQGAKLEQGASARAAIPWLKITMPEHVIHLRRAWTGRFLEADALVERRIDLPIVWGAEPIPERIARGFHKPPFNPNCESLFLHLESIAGLESVRINNREIETDRNARGRFELSLVEIHSGRNLIELAIDPRALSDRTSPWGFISLVIRTEA